VRAISASCEAPVARRRGPQLDKKGGPSNDPVGYPNFPGRNAAMKAFNQTGYFREDADAAGVPAGRKPKAPFDRHVHFNDLNSRRSRKPNAELLYFANARPVRGDGSPFPCDW